METKTFKTAKQVAKELMRIANAYGLVYESAFIVNDMNLYAKRQIEYANAMKIKNFGKFNYTENYYIREHGVEDSRLRLDSFGGHLATITVKFDMIKGEYTVTKNNA